MKNRRILIVEDESIIAMNLKLSLEDQGYQVLPVAQTANDAVQYTVLHRPDLILMDLILRGQQTGVDAALEIQSKKPCPIIYLTGNTHLLDDKRDLGLTFDYVFSKPPDFHALLTVMAKILS